MPKWLPYCYPQNLPMLQVTSELERSRIVLALRLTSVQLCQPVNLHESGVCLPPYRQLSQTVHLQPHLLLLRNLPRPRSGRANREPDLVTALHTPCLYIRWGSSVGRFALSVQPHISPPSVYCPNGSSGSLHGVYEAWGKIIPIAIWSLVGLISVKFCS